MHTATKPDTDVRLWYVPPTARPGLGSIRLRQYRKRVTKALLSTFRTVNQTLAARSGRAPAITHERTRQVAGQDDQQTPMTISDNDQQTDSSNASKPSNNYLQAVLARLPGHPPRVQAAVDEHGRFWLEDTRGSDDAYLWTRDTVDVEAVR